MILINVRFIVQPEHADSFRETVAPFTAATRAEDGCLFFDWFRSTDKPNEYILVEGFKDDAAEPHVNSDHFKQACELFPTVLVETPQIINTLIEGKTEWDRMAEFSVD
ncbi:antibiotic biosynthesis monooxygenase [Corynebacterium sp. CCM 9185]|uniref:Antibiotic biosynthesis monooxygenase n=1 Tax=Corynebacterium marambiense TaxID=2765364 RepID=A0ABS0VTC0_9CORY|nr:putative quinol monooxygenase [Corynebacterium marambiense]MBI9000009.1 antibiotic biosynthesis monooxygenase [Corynebacterium marambiense]MCK7663361.1 antibiotic biosynthesis monooxygenase [Corynebacterium marambiense]MCX7542205.1 putative quinol monooxygenase [Corynebacterium marambiense]